MAFVKHQYDYYTTSPCMLGGHLVKMFAERKPVIYETALDHCVGLTDWALRMNYLLMGDGSRSPRRDYRVQVFKSFYRGMRCYYVMRCHIAYVWLHREDLAAFIQARQAG